MPNPRGGILLAAGFAVAALAAGLLIRQRPGTAAGSPEPAWVPVSTPPGPSPAGPERPARPSPAPLPALRDLPALPPVEKPPHDPGSPETLEWIERRTGELDQLAWNDDPESLRKILAELRSPLPEIRAAALGATKAFGSREAIPYLEAIARDTADPHEHRALGLLIEHLKLPTLLEQSETIEPE